MKITNRPFGRITAPVNHVYLDLGTGSITMGCSREGDENCREIGNYPEAQASTPSLVPQAPSNTIYEPQNEGAAKPVAFGHAKPRSSKRHVQVSNVKIAILPDREVYSYAYSLLVDASDRLGLSSVEQVTEDFLSFAVAHAINECGGQPKKGWVCSVPQSYGIADVQRFRSMIYRAGAIGSIDIHGESDCVLYASLPWIENLIRNSKHAAFKQDRNYSILVAVLDLGAGTTVRIPKLRKRWTG